MAPRDFHQKYRQPDVIVDDRRRHLFFFSLHSLNIDYQRSAKEGGLNDVTTPTRGVARQGTYRGRALSRTIAFDIARFPVAFLPALYRQRVTDTREVSVLCCVHVLLRHRLNDTCNNTALHRVVEGLLQLPATG